MRKYIFSRKAFENVPDSFLMFNKWSGGFSWCWNYVILHEIKILCWCWTYDMFSSIDDGLGVSEVTVKLWAIKNMNPLNTEASLTNIE